MSIDFFPLPMLVGLAMLAIILPTSRLKKHSTAYLFVFSGFWIYLLLVIGLTLFPLVLPLPGETRQPVEILLARVNLIPFNFGRAVRLDFALNSQLVGNILLTIPFGFLLPLVVRMNAAKFFRYAVGIGVVIELGQLGLSFVAGGSYYRITDINDVLLNWMGAMIGYGMLRILSRISGFIIRESKTRPE